MMRWENMSYMEWLRELGLFSLEKWKDDLITLYSWKEVAVRRGSVNFWQAIGCKERAPGCAWGGLNWTSGRISSRRVFILWNRLPKRWWSLNPWRHLGDMWTWCLGTWFSSDIGSVTWMVRPDDLFSNLKIIWFWDSGILGRFLWEELKFQYDIIMKKSNRTACMPAGISDHSGGKRKFNSGQSKIMLVSRKHGSQQLHQGCWKADTAHLRADHGLQTPARYLYQKGTVQTTLLAGYTDTMIFFLPWKLSVFIKKIKVLR